MAGASRVVGLATLGLVLLGVGALVLFAGGSPPAPTAGATGLDRPQAERVAPPAGKRAQPAGDPRELVLADQGNPVVWVRRGHEVALRSRPGGPPIQTLPDETEFGSRTVLAVFERRDDWVGVPSPHAGNGALGWVRLDGRELRSGYTFREIVVDLSERRAQLLVEDEVVRTFTVSIGAPGTATPTGRFAVTDTFRGGLNQAYGCCAVALTAEQPSLPSGWLGGNRIAFHGTSGPLGEAISAGCVRAADRDVDALVDEVPPGAPVLITE